MDDISHRPRQEIFKFPNEASQKIDAPNFYPSSEIIDSLLNSLKSFFKFLSPSSSIFIKEYRWSDDNNLVVGVMDVFVKVCIIIKFTKVAKSTKSRFL